MNGDPRRHGPFAFWQKDVPASLVVFLVALPLCLGIALASGAPAIAGLLTGVVGGLVVAWISGSHLAVSGPAAGLTVIVLAAIGTLGYPAFVLAVLLAGAIQIALGAIRAGVLAYYVPSSVIKGMLAAIGLILILKELPHAVGFDSDYEGDLSFQQLDHGNTFEALGAALGYFRWPALLVAGAGLTVLLAADRWKWIKEKLPWLPPPLLAVALGVGVNQLIAWLAPDAALSGEHLVAVPRGGLDAIVASLTFPDFSRIADAEVWKTAGILAAVASIETLLCIEAIDKLDPHKRTTSTNRELLAQGLGNVICGLVGALPMTAVIVRGSTNVHSGAQTRLSAFFHGIWLLVAVLLLADVISLVPRAALAAVLLHVGLKLASPQTVTGMFRQPISQWAPFVVTVGAVVLTDLLIGVLVGLGVAVVWILRDHLRTPFFLEQREDCEDGRRRVVLELTPNVSFLHRASVNRALHELPDGAVVEIDARRARSIHPDVVELIREIEETAPDREIRVVIRGREQLERASGLAMSVATAEGNISS